MNDYGVARGCALGLALSIVAWIALVAIVALVLMALGATPWVPVD